MSIESKPDDAFAAVFQTPPETEDQKMLRSMAHHLLALADKPEVKITRLVQTRNVLRIHGKLPERDYFTHNGVVYDFHVQYAPEPFGGSGEDEDRG